MKAGVAAERERVGDYQLIKAIGAGGSARIDLARIERAFGFQRHVVIKRPLEHLRDDARAATSLRQEARLGGRLRHPNLIAILDAGVHDGYDYLVLEYVHGGSLRALVQADAPGRVLQPPLEVAIALVADVARGLHAAHELPGDDGAPLGLVHRDVSPGNILIGTDGAVKLADFGSAKETRVQTLSGSMQGTVTYMAPEQCRGHAFDRRADVWSLGVILHELLTGHRLFFADNDVASLHRVLAGDVPRPRKLRPSLSSALEDIVMAALAPDQDRRFTTARELADALELEAGATGAILGARWIARWVHELIGPRDVPWIGAATIPSMAAVADPSLVDLIEAVPADEPPLPTFGPTIPGSPDDLDTQPRREPGRPRPRRRAIAGALVFALAGAGATALVLNARSTTDGATDAPTVPGDRDRPVAAPAGSAKQPPPQAADPAQADPPATELVHETDPDPDPPATEPGDSPKPPRRRRPAIARPPITPAGSGSAATEPVAETPPPKPAGSGSQATRPKVEWNPTMLLPTDGKKKKEK